MLSIFKFFFLRKDLYIVSVSGTKHLDLPDQKFHFGNIKLEMSIRHLLWTQLSSSQIICIKDLIPNVIVFEYRAFKGGNEG